MSLGGNKINDGKTASEATFKLQIFRLGLRRNNFLVGIEPAIKAKSSCMNTISSLKDQYPKIPQMGNLYLPSSYYESDTILDVFKHSGFHRHLGK